LVEADPKKQTLRSLMEVPFVDNLKPGQEVKSTALTQSYLASEIYVDGDTI